MSQADEIVKIIKAIGEIWPFLITVFLIFVAIIKWKAIWAAIDNIGKVKLKSGSTEIEMVTKGEEKLAIEKIEIQKAKEPTESISEEKNETLSHSQSY